MFQRACIGGVHLLTNLFVDCFVCRSSFCYSSYRFHVHLSNCQEGFTLSTCLPIVGLLVAWSQIVIRAAHTQVGL